jgi:hypothetical protein
LLFSIYSTPMSVTQAIESNLVGKPERIRPLGSTRSRWADNIKLDLREIRWNGMDWLELARIGTSLGRF